MNTDRPLLGVILMLCFCAVIPLGDAIAKLLGGVVPLVQMLAVRFGIQAVLLLPIVWLSRRQLVMPGWVFRLTVVRTIVHMFGVGLMFLSLQYLPLAGCGCDCICHAFHHAAAWQFVLDEEVGMRRMVACVVGFVGTLLVIQPSFEEVGAPALLPLLVALSFSLFMLVTRKIAKEVDPMAMQCVSGGIATVILGVAYLLLMPFDLSSIQFVTTDFNTGTLLLSLGVIGTLAHLLMTWSLRFAPSATLAPMQYLEIPVATLLGWLIFHDLPNDLAAIGIVITILAGLYVIIRERQVSIAEQARSSS